VEDNRTILGIPNDGGDNDILGRFISVCTQEAVKRASRKGVVKAIEYVNSRFNHMQSQKWRF